MTLLTGFTCKTGTVNFSSKSQRSKSPYYANFKQKGTKLKNEKNKIQFVKKIPSDFRSKDLRPRGLILRHKTERTRRTDTKLRDTLEARAWPEVKQYGSWLWSRLSRFYSQLPYCFTSGHALASKVSRSLVSVLRVRSVLCLSFSEDQLTLVLKLLIENCESSPISPI